MPAAIRFHLDEHIHGAVAQGLRRRGIDVSTTAEAGLMAATDEEQLAFARTNGRVLVTHDADFLRLHQGGQSHTGIVHCQQRGRSIGDLIRHLVLIREILLPEEMNDHVEFL